MKPGIGLVAAEIARRRKELAVDSAENVEQLVIGLLKDALEPHFFNPNCGAAQIEKERCRQITQEGWTPEHDDRHTKGELIDAAQGYIRAAINTGHPAMATPPQVWPWDEVRWKPSPDKARNLAKAGALIAAEIDRLQRRATLKTE